MRASHSKRFERFRSDKLQDNREAAQRDRDRILYTSAFQRLAEVTQVVSAEEGHVFHNRLTHSLKVAQVGRRIAEKLIRGQASGDTELPDLNPDVIEAAAFAHDLGHPPFGHVAEKELDRLVVKKGLSDGFEGNAQSFRIVTKLARRIPGRGGLNLTRATLNAMLKYPWLRGQRGKRRQKWGAYETEREEFNWVRRFSPQAGTTRCPEADLMDWADDVTYAVHDAADFFRAGLIPLDRLASSQNISERERFFEGIKARQRHTGTKPEYSVKEFEQVFDIITSFPFNEPFRGTGSHRSSLRNYTAELIARYVNAVSLPQRNLKDRKLEIPESFRREVALLKELTWQYVILNPSLATQQVGQRIIIRTMFSTFHRAALRPKEHCLFPHAFQDQIEDTYPNRRELTRIVADFVASLTEHQAIGMYNRITGSTLGSVWDPFVR